MIHIFYNGVGIPAEDDGTPINPPSYWTPEILAGIAQSFADGHWEPIPDPAPPPPEPDWVGFNLAMIPPTTKSTFEMWLDQFKEPYRVALTVASSEGNVERVQEQYNIFKEFIPPTAEQIAEWQELADTYNISLTF